jgi:hypothetical protein
MRAIKDALATNSIATVARALSVAFLGRGELKSIILENAGSRNVLSRLLSAVSWLCCSVGKRCKHVSTGGLIVIM